MNSDLAKLQPYPFTKLRDLKADLSPPPDKDHIDLSVGEPKHPSPKFVEQQLIRELSALSKYPSTRGITELRRAIANWLKRRFKLTTLPDPETQILPVNGTREALFAFAQAVVNRGISTADNQRPLVVMPNPFYQIYEGAALLAGGQPFFVNCTSENNFTGDFSQIPDTVWRKCQLLYLCTPGNPSGAVTAIETLKYLVTMADRHNFIIASDECYSEIYTDEKYPPPGLLQACAELGLVNYRRCVVFHSLSKRSNLPGLRSGFVAGDAEILNQFLRYRTYHGCAMPIQHQLASVVAWNDEVHVQSNRLLYREKLIAVTEILQQVMNVSLPPAGFYLWPETPISDIEFTRNLYAKEHISVVPGSYLARDTATENPGTNRVRIALVPQLAQCREAANRISSFIQDL